MVNYATKHSVDKEDEPHAFISMIPINVISPFPTCGKYFATSGRMKKEAEGGEQRKNEQRCTPKVGDLSFQFSLSSLDDQHRGASSSINMILLNYSNSTC